jgi:hypothetical protein
MDAGARAFISAQVSVRSNVGSSRQVRSFSAWGSFGSIIPRSGTGRGAVPSRVDSAPYLAAFVVSSYSTIDTA